jgi:hypothetical protein
VKSQAQNNDNKYTGKAVAQLSKKKNENTSFSLLTGRHPEVEKQQHFQQIADNSLQQKSAAVVQQMADKRSSSKPIQMMQEPEEEEEAPQAAPALNANAPEFVMPDQPPAPEVEEAADHEEAGEEEEVPDPIGQIINLPPAAEPYVVTNNWHPGFEAWAMAYPQLFPEGMVGHYNVQAGAHGPQLHVYQNALGQFEVVPHGGTPSGF